MKSNTKRICLAALFTALIFVFTAWLHIPSHTGYTHVGDGFLFLAACLLPWQYGVSCGVAGAFLADCLTGYAMWAPGSIIIKGVTALFFTAKGEKILSWRNLLGLIPAGALCIGGYYCYEGLITGNFTAPLAGIPGYVTQWVLSSALYLVAGFTLDKLKIKKTLRKEGLLE